MRQRQRTIGFCHSVLNGQNKQICDVIEEHNFSPLNIARLELTKETIVSSAHVRNYLTFDLFASRTFAYALKLDEYHILHSKEWYGTDLLVCSLTDVLIENGFGVTIQSKCEIVILRLVFDVITLLEKMSNILVTDLSYRHLTKLVRFLDQGRSWYDLGKVIFRDDIHSKSALDTFQNGGDKLVVEYDCELSTESCHWSLSGDR